MRALYIGIGAVALMTGCRMEEDATPVQKTEAQLEQDTKLNPSLPEKSPQNPPESNVQSNAAVVAPGVGACQPSEKMETLVTKLAEHADADNDGAISKHEAESTMNFVLGGMFFRSDENGDGTITPEEAREVREEFAEKNPAIAALFGYARSVKQATGAAPFARIAEIVDVDYKESVSAQDVRQASNAALDDLYQVADRDKNGIITLAEARNASLAGTAALGGQMFEAADKDDDGTVELSELKTAVDSTLTSAFQTADKNSDGKLTQEEAKGALDVLASRLGLPEVPTDPGG